VRRRAQLVRQEGAGIKTAMKSRDRHALAPLQSQSWPTQLRHCEERVSATKQSPQRTDERAKRDCFASLAMTQ
jgi:hypothetical protein